MRKPTRLQNMTKLTNEQYDNLHQPNCERFNNAVPDTELDTVIVETKRRSNSYKYCPAKFNEQIGFIEEHFYKTTGGRGYIKMKRMRGSGQADVQTNEAEIHNAIRRRFGLELDKIIDNKLRATDTNVGRAGTLDLFKLYDENKLNNTGSQDELSRLLIKFDLTKPRKLLNQTIDITDASFKAKIRLYDVRSGHALPSNFNVIAHPLSQSFDEGPGRDLSSFSDLSSTNFLTSSVKSGTALGWYASGANFEGGLGAQNVDIIGSGTVGVSSMQYYYGVQHFPQGNEDLLIDVTKAVSGTLAGFIPDHGFRIAFSGSDENDKKSRFVKRFGSRHSANPLIRPVLEISFDDSIQDNRGNFYFDNTGSIFLQNNYRTNLANLKLTGTDVTGQDSLRVKLVKGDYSKTFFASQHTGPLGLGKQGIYSASLSISSDDTGEYARGKTLSSLISREKEVTFTEYWQSLDGTKAWHTGSLTIKALVPNSSLFEDNIDVYSTNCKASYSRKDQSRIQLFGINNEVKKEKSGKKPRHKKSEILENVFYRVLDADALVPIFEFGQDDNSTRVSTDGEGMYFDFHFDILPPGRAYLFEYLIVDKNSRKILRDRRTRFTVL